MQEALGLNPAPHVTRQADIHLWSQHLGATGRRIRNSASSLICDDFETSLGYLRLFKEGDGGGGKERGRRKKKMRRRGEGREEGRKMHG